MKNLVLILLLCANIVLAQGVRVDPNRADHPRKQLLLDETLVCNNLLTEAPQLYGFLFLK